ncbi:MAG: helix-turn-helix transcriptional regulator [Ruminococcaceae bacterium]|nr:helix-turn-helix transcriptional regulator [Oscillospiraceae bacterium]
MLRIKELREDRDLRQSDLARATGIDQRTISNYETGKSNPDSYALIRLADFFEVSVDYLLGRTERDLFSSTNKKRAIDEIQSSLEDLKRIL